MHGKRLFPEAGSAMVSFAVCFPVLFLFVAGIIDWSLVFYSHHLAINAAREGARQLQDARYEAIRTEPNAPLRCLAKKQFINDIMLPGLPDTAIFRCRGDAPDQCLSTDRIYISDPEPLNKDPAAAGQGENTNPDVVRVTVRCTHDFTLLRMIGLNSLTLKAQAMMPVS